ncbi:hypothetical protein OQA88_12218 [Cercophora sp. LCS_1]
MPANKTPAGGFGRWGPEEHKALLAALMRAIERDGSIPVSLASAQALGRTNYLMQWLAHSYEDIILREMEDQDIPGPLKAPAE